MSLTEKETNIGAAGQTRIDKTGKAILCAPSAGTGPGSVSLTHVTAPPERQSEKNGERFWGR